MEWSTLIRCIMRWTVSPELSNSAALHTAFEFKHNQFNELPNARTLLLEAQVEDKMCFETHIQCFHKGWLFKCICSKITNTCCGASADPPSISIYGCDLVSLLMSFKYWSKLVFSCIKGNNIKHNRLNFNGGAVQIVWHVYIVCNELKVL